MTVNVSEIKKGDEIEVRLIAAEDGNRLMPPGVSSGYWMRFKDSAGIFHELHTASITAHYPAPREFEVGDMVRNRHCATSKDRNPGAPIMAIADGWAMVKFWNDPTAIKLDNLELAE